jgi:hypothetical protein
MKINLGKLNDYFGYKLIGQIEIANKEYPLILKDDVYAVLDKGIVKYLNQADVKEALKRAEK